MSEMKPFFKQVQSHYDLSDEFFELFLDPTRTYSCAYFEDPQATLEQAQMAKIDLSLGKCKLLPGMKLLDIGCGWGATAIRAAEKYQANVIGLTLSENQYQYCTRRAGELAGPETAEFRLQGWEDFNEPVLALQGNSTRRWRYDVAFHCHYFPGGPPGPGHPVYAGRRPVR